MKKLFKKSWFIGIVIISLMLIVFFLNLWILSIKLTSPYTDHNFWSLAADPLNGNSLSLFAFIIMVAFYVSIIPMIMTGIGILKKNNFGFIAAILYFLGFGIIIIVFQSINPYLSVFALILTIFNILLIVGIFILMILRKKVLIQTEDFQKTESEIRLSNTKIPLYVLFIDIASIIALLTTFMIPLYSIDEFGSTYNAIIINVLLAGDTNLASMIYFFIDFGIFIAILLYFANCLSNYFFDKEKFIKKSKSLVTLSFIATLLFFLTGLGINIYYTFEGDSTQTFAYIPLLIMLIIIFVHAIFRGIFIKYYQPVNLDVKVKFAKIESLFYVILLTSITVLMLFLPIIKISVISSNYNYFVNLTGFTILSDYANLDQGYHTVAFILVVMLISVGIALVVALTSYLSKYRQFGSIVKLVTIINIFFVFIVAISGYYFQIAKEINQAVILDIFDFYGVSLPTFLDYDYTISTDAIYALIASMIVLVMMFFRKAFDQNDMSSIEINPSTLNSESLSSDKTSSNLVEEAYETFDPCPAFTEIDSKVDLFKENLEKRIKLKAKDPTLNGLVHFVVDYAKNSRLHLSYSHETIATFISGLGAGRLSILQGMSGTGKTSLPKIFSEAIYGICEIIEVESSWKDKNELLGYYNEFSMKYTPKKFTLALYKAALNQEIPTFILLDEMNLSRIEYYFSDFLSLMENEENQRDIKLVNINLERKEEGNEIEYLALSNGKTLKVPSNVWFIGTANRDESTFVISDKVYDRAHTMNFTKRAPKVRNYSSPISQRYYDYKTINNLLVEAKKNGDFDAENNQIIKSVEALLAPYNISFGNRILNQIEDFVNVYKTCFEHEDVEKEAIENILLTKVVAKLELKVIDDKEKLETGFEKLNLHQCVDFIKQLDNE